MNEESKLIELFKKYPGIAARIRRSFAYHYDQIQREIEYYLKNQKLFTLSPKILSVFSNPLSNEN